MMWHSPVEAVIVRPCCRRIKPVEVNSPLVDQTLKYLVHISFKAKLKEAPLWRMASAFQCNLASQKKGVLHVPSFFFLVIRSAYRLYGKPGNSGENSNGTVYPGGNFLGKKIIPFDVLPFSRFCRNNRNILYHFFVLPVPGFKSRESHKFTCIL